jgi:antibiotic biosynthesis monooxygenase (ABM) superfamily enzyme
MAGRGNMIRVIVGYKFRDCGDASRLLFRLTSYAMTYPGFIGAENLQSLEVKSVIAMIETWDTREQWHAWEASPIRRSIIHEWKHLLEEEPRVAEYRVVPSCG